MSLLSPKALQLTLKVAHIVVSLLHKPLKGMEMSLAERLKALAANIQASAPHLTDIVHEVEAVIDTVAPVVAAVAPGTQAATIVAEVASAVHVGENVGNALGTAVVGTLQSVAAAASAPAPVSLPPAPAPQTTVDQGTLAALNVTATAGAPASPDALSSRVMMLESALYELLPAVAVLLQKFGR